MIFILNECAKPQWKVEKLEHPDNTYRLSLMNGKISIDVKTDGETQFNEDALTTINDVREFTKLLDMKTVVRFDYKNLHPRIMSSSSDFNCDFFIVSFDIGQYRLINQMRKNAYTYLQYYDYETRTMTMLFSLNMRGVRAFIENVFMSDDEKTVMMKHLTWSGKYNKPIIITRAASVDRVKTLKRGDRGFIDIRDRTLPESGGKVYKLPVFIPMRPTKLFVVNNNEDFEIAKKLTTEIYKNDLEKNIVLNIEELGEEDFRKKAKEQCSSGYKAITYFTKDISYEEYHDNWSEHSKTILNEKCGKFFNHVLLMTNEGRVSRLY